MSKRLAIRLTLYAALFVLLQGAKCPTIPTTKEIDVSVITEEYIELEFLARGSINYHSDTETIDIDDLRRELEDAGVDIAAVDTIVVSSVLYGVTAYNETPTDREIVDGMVTVTRTDTDSTAVIVSDADVEVYPLLGDLVPAPIEPDGIAFINDLLADVLDALKYSGPSEFSVFADVSGVSQPQGRETSFDWRLRIYYHVTGRMGVEVIDI